MVTEIGCAGSFRYSPSMLSLDIPLVIVAAVAENGAIGRGNAMPWSMPGDLARFRELTLGKPVIMGRRTHESIGRVLPGRESIVVTRGTGIAPAQGLWTAASPDAALALAQERALALHASEIVLAGGGELYRALMPKVQRMRLSLIGLRPEADTFFPAIDPSLWRETARQAAPRHARDEASCVHVDYERRG